MATATKMIRRSLETPDEVRPFPHGRLELVSAEGPLVGRGTFEPGWRWSNDVKPIAGTASCQAAHAGYVVSGHMHVIMDDGSEADFGPSDVMIVPSGHDAWTVGDEACVVIDWQGFADYAKPH